MRVERRRYERYDAMLAARVYDTASGKTDLSLVSGISEGGCGLLSSSRLVPGKTVMCELVIGVSTVRVIAEVVSGYMQSENVFVSSLKFLMLEENAISCLKAFMNRMNPEGNQ